MTISINQRITDSLEELNTLVNKTSNSEHITFPFKMALESFQFNLLESADIYTGLREKYSEVLLPSEFSEKLVKQSQPLINKIDEVVKLLKSTNSIRDTEIADSFIVFKRSLEQAQILNDQNYRNYLRSERFPADLELDSLLGKITKINFISKESLFGLEIEFSCNGGNYGVIDNTYQWHSIKSQAKHSNNCKWSPASQFNYSAETMAFVNKIMDEAKVTRLSDLVNKPVEIFFDDMQLHSFRILTEVL